MLRAIAKAIGTVVRIDYNTESTEWRKFACLVVSVDLTKYLVSKIQIEGHLQRVEYEGLPTICFECGCYDHLREQCPKKSKEVIADGETCPEENTRIVLPLPVAQGKKFGLWMQVVYRGKRNDRKGNNPANKEGFVTTDRNGSGSRFDLIIEILEGDFVTSDCT
ncbi:uncharacterized protein LOC110822953 [Carica papaya]|uniref:uncharacterized protein LOC110822953 n=1 Tax=Carica papaya TaxID=3649 RepID=UPI000B8CF0EE|nr:uncharacterized protein LOC110822953 [Carica papaya]